MDPPYFPSCLRGELRKDLGRAAEDFTCSCPYDDTRMGADEADPAGGEAICDFRGDVNTPAQCEDKIPHNATISRKWEQIQRVIELAPCCPPGENCGMSCETEEGTKEVCRVERRQVGVMTNLPKEVSCWEGCYLDCAKTDACNCKRKCRRECRGWNGSSDRRRKRAVVRKIGVYTEKRGKCVKGKRKSA
jgi:hypothetical protein